MYGVIYGDLLAHLIVRTDQLLRARSETFARSVEVSNRKSAASRRAVIFTASPGGGTGDTLRTAYVTVDVIANDEGDAVDLMNLTLALVTSRGAGGMVDGQPIVAASLNGGPNADPAADGFYAQTAELELAVRGRDL
ncbi:hypothetical protein [Curtobacterium sp. MCBA15_004]|uniref:hypothetical protein n=1 Tax=Curtobacterium sp. MCBA15_004 TaxID=1898733 RepID=UPI0008DC669C|nr:hypothetical protein [Curtobacterium sp. MCBA15_004]WIA95803.1 hypothetical protein QOL16_11855 [Curtobacterium sp. MCBA15_004]